MRSGAACDGAAASFREAARLEPQNGVYYANLGEVERLRGKLDDALTALETAVRLDPGSTQALNNLGIVRFERREFEEAAECYRKAIAKDDRVAFYTGDEISHNRSGGPTCLTRPLLRE